MYTVCRQVQGEQETETITIVLTLYVARSSTIQDKVASLPTDTVTLWIGSANLGISETETKLSTNY